MAKSPPKRLQLHPNFRPGAGFPGTGHPPGGWASGQQPARGNTKETVAGPWSSVPTPRPFRHPIYALEAEYDRAVANVIARIQSGQIKAQPPTSRGWKAHTSHRYHKRTSGALIGMRTFRRIYILRAANCCSFLALPVCPPRPLPPLGPRCGPKSTPNTPAWPLRNNAFGPWCSFWRRWVYATY